jgi:DNA invertase Pin-like site-specific DNA recombinase
VYIQHTWKPRPSGEHVTKSNLFFRERVRAGIERAKASGTKTGRRFGRPALKDGSKGLAKIAAIKAELAAGKGIRRIARDQGAGVGTVLRVKAELAA